MQTSRNYSPLQALATCAQSSTVHSRELVGKRIQHKWCHEDGSEHWYTLGLSVTCTKNGLHVKYDLEDDLEDETESL